MTEPALTAGYWVRQYRCNNPDCCDGLWPIQVAHRNDTKDQWCAWCGVKAIYECDVGFVPARSGFKNEAD